MGKLSQAASRAHDAAAQLLDAGRPLTLDEQEQVLNDWQPGADLRVEKLRALFTPLDIAHEFAVFAKGPRGRYVDLGAGIGALSWACLRSDAWSRDVTELVCIEQSPELVEIGRKVVPEARWICGDMFDRDLLLSLGEVAMVISNPPFGKNNSLSARWLRYRGVSHLQAAEVAIRLCGNGATLLLPDSALPWYRDRFGCWTAKRYPPEDYRRWSSKWAGAMLVPEPVDLSPWLEQWSYGVRVAVSIASLDVWPAQPAGFAP